MAGTGTLVENDLDDNGELQEMIVQKAQQLFGVCDKEQKGFASKRDMQRLQTELPLTPEQLEDVFDSLDHDGNGFLTLEEFTDGFGMFLGLTAPDPPAKRGADIIEVTTPERVYENDHIDAEDEEETFGTVMENLGAYGILDDEDVVKGLWSNMRRDNPDMLENFEQFLSRVCGEIKRTQTDYRSLESALRNKTSVHDEELRRLYDEMEQQIRHEKERVLIEEKAKERQMRDELEREIAEKDRQLQEILQRHREMEDKLQEVNAVESEIKQENEKLYKERELLEDKLHKSQESLDESKSYINQLRNQHRTEKRDRARTAMQLSEGIALERETLVKQLDVLRDMNKKLRDDRDINDSKKMSDINLRNSRFQEGSLAQEMNEAMNGERAPQLSRQSSQVIMNSAAVDGAIDGVKGGSADAVNGHLSADSGVVEERLGASESQPLSKSTGSINDRRNQFQKQGSLLSNYFGDSKSSIQNSIDEEDGIEYEEYIPPTQRQTSFHSNMTPEQIAESYIEHNNLNATTGSYGNYREDAGSTCSDNDNFDNIYGVRDRRTKKGDANTYLGSNIVGGEGFYDPASSRMQPLGANTSHDQVEDPSQSPPEPERFFKVVFVGDSGVGKSSFIYRYCSDTFKSTFSATIGVDFQVKTLEVDGHWVALQLWDTAGQERFRSITKQYFRKADGVLIMYDVTSETSFTNVRNWLTSVQEGTDEGTVLVLVGNKTDLCEDDDSRVVKTKDGARLADEFGSLFYEVSAKSGVNVKDTIYGMASLLREKEDSAIEKALRLEADVGKKKGCCGK